MFVSRGRQRNPVPSATKNALGTTADRNPLLSSNHMQNGIETRNVMGPQLARRVISSKSYKQIFFLFLSFATNQRINSYIHLSTYDIFYEDKHCFAVLTINIANIC